MNTMNAEEIKFLLFMLEEDILGLRKNIDYYEPELFEEFREILEQLRKDYAKLLKIKGKLLAMLEYEEAKNA